MSNDPPLTLSYQSGKNFLVRESTSLRLKPTLGSQGATVVATSPKGNDVTLNVIKRNGVYTTDFRPNEIGIWKFSVLLRDGSHVEGSPFNVRVFNLQGVDVRCPTQGVAKERCFFEVDTSKAGEGHLSVRVTLDGREVPLELKRDEMGVRNRGYFVPANPGIYSLVVFFAGDVVGSPYQIDISAEENITIDPKTPYLIRVNREYDLDLIFSRTVTRFDADNVAVKIVGPLPRDKDIEAVIFPLNNNSKNNVIRISFIPIAVGDHEVAIYYKEKPFLENSVVISAYDPASVRIVYVPKVATVGKPWLFDVDVVEAGKGELQVSINRGQVPFIMENLGKGLHRVTFEPKKDEVYFIEVKFNGEEVPNSPFQVEAEANVELSGVGSGRGILNQINHFFVTINSPNNKTPTANLIGPDGKTLACTLKKIKPGYYKCEYLPEGIGKHELKFSLNGSPQNKESKFFIDIFDPASIAITPTNQVATLGEPTTVIVDVRKAGHGDMKVQVSRGSKNVQHKIEKVEGSEGLYQVTFTPTEVKDHLVSVSLNDITQQNCSINIPVIDKNQLKVTGEGVSYAAVNQKSGFKLIGQKLVQDGVVVVITAMDGKEKIPVEVTKMNSNAYNIEYVTMKVGDYRAEVKYKGVTLGQGPFVIKSFDPNKVKVDGLKDTILNTPTVFMINTESAGEGNMMISIESVDNKNVKIPSNVEQSGSKFKVEFIPKRSGPYKVNVLFNDKYILGNPFLFNVFDIQSVTLKSAELGDVERNKNVSLVLSALKCNATDFQAFVTDPENKKKPARIVQSSANEVVIGFNPLTIGEYVVEATYKGHAIVGFPKVINVWDASQVRVKSIEPVDASQSGNGKLVVDIRDPDNIGVPTEVQSSSQSQQFISTFTPTKPGQHKVNVKFNGVQVKGSPFSASVFDDTKFKVTGEGLGQTSVNRPTLFYITSLQKSVYLDPNNLSINISDPQGNPVNYQLTSPSSDTFLINYTPNKVGQFTTEVKWAGLNIGSSPYKTEVIDISHVVVSHFPVDVVIYNTVEFIVDASNSGNGRLNVNIQTPTNSQYSARIVPLSSFSLSSTPLSSSLSKLPSMSSNEYRVTFETRESGRHYVNVLYEDEHIPGSPFVCQVHDPKKLHVQWQDIKIIPANKHAELLIESDQLINSDLISAKIIGPQGESLHTSVLPLKQTSTYSKSSAAVIEFTPTNVGEHRISVTYLGQNLTGSPYVSDVFDPFNVFADFLNAAENSRFPVYKKVEFTVESGNAGKGDPTTEVTFQGRPVEVRKVKMNKEVNMFSFTPSMPGEYLVHVKFNNENVLGFPKLIDVFSDTPPPPSGPTPQTRPVETGSQYEPYDGGNQFSSATQTNLDGNYEKAVVVVTAPTGDMITGKLIRIPSGEYKADYKSPFTGRHKVEVVYEGCHIMNSPYYVDLHDAAKVNIISPKQVWIIGETVDFEVVTKNAGNADLSVKVLEPTGSPLECRCQRTCDGYRIEWKPRMEGPHRTFVKFGEEPVTGGHPLVQEVMNPPEAVASGDGLTKGWVDEQAQFIVDGKKQKGKLIVEVKGPNSVAKVTVDSLQNGLYQVSYIPNEVGVFEVVVIWNGRDVKGSPFKPRIFDITKVKVKGGWESLIDPTTKTMDLSKDVVNKILLNTWEAGGGMIMAEVIKDGRPEHVDVTRVDDHQYMVSFVPHDTGDYQINMMFENRFLPNCPITGVTLPSFHDALNGKMNDSRTNFMSPANNINANEVITSGKGLKVAFLGQMNEFIVDGSLAGPGQPEAKLREFDGRAVPVAFSRVNQDIYKCQYVPRTLGSHILTVNWSGEAVPSSPFKLNVTEVSDPLKVICTGEGLKRGIFGEDIRAYVDTREAGAGLLDVCCTGNSTAASCTLRNREDGIHVLTLRPQELGRHRLDVLFAGKHVPGSPFSLKISPPPDATVVKVFGPGIENGLLHNFQSHFYVDTTGAGAGQLVVRVRGPKRAFCVEMQRDERKFRLIKCRYEPTETGKYWVQISWSGINVPQSPFEVNIVDTMEELNKVMMQAPAPASHVLPLMYECRRPYDDDEQPPPQQHVSDFQAYDYSDINTDYPEVGSHFRSNNNGASYFDPGNLNNDGDSGAFRQFNEPSQIFAAQTTSVLSSTSSHSFHTPLPSPRQSLNGVQQLRRTKDFS